jgi:eukaryotic-like serine/threonine-protein kinase
MTIQCPTCLGNNPDGSISCLSCGEQLSINVTGSHLPPNTTLHNGQYQIIKTLGEGGFGITYKGIDLSNGNTEVAIKELWPERSNRNSQKSIEWPLLISPQEKRNQIDSFQKEAENISKCIHPSIVKVFNYFTENNTAYIIMEFIKGQPLSEIQKNAGDKLGEATIKKYFLHVAEALKVVHAANLLHRDIKPDNIIVNDSDRAILIDFGNARGYIAGVTNNMTRNLTPGYAPLEQYITTGKRGPSTDFYAVCASMYHLLTGVIPPEPAALSAGWANLIPPSQILPSVDRLLEQIIMSGLKEKAEERFQTADELIEALKGRFISPLLKKAQDLVKQNRLSDAISAYEKCLVAEPNNDLAVVEMAIVMLHNNDPRTEATAQQAVKIAPEDGRGQGILGLIECRQSNWLTALKHLKEAEQYASQEPWIQANLAWAEAKTGDWNNAYQRVCRVQPLAPDEVFIGTLKSWIAANQQNWKMAIKDAQSTIKSSSLSTQSNSQMHQDCAYSCLLFALENFINNPLTPYANKCLQEFLSTLPTSSFAQGFKGYRQAQFQRWAEAEVSLKNISNVSSQWILTNLAISQEQQRKTTEAFITYDKISRQFRESSFALFRMGTICAQKSDWSTAQKYLEESIKLNDSVPETHHNLGWVVSNIKTADGQAENPRQILESYRKAVDLYLRQRRSSDAQQIKAAFDAIDITL